jgi:aspartate kinase
VEFARNHGVPLQVRSSFTWEPGTTINEEDPSMEQPLVTAVTHDLSEAKVTLPGVPDKPGISAKLFRALADHAINVDMIVQNSSLHGTTDISFTVPEDDLETSMKIANDLAKDIKASAPQSDSDIAKVSLIGAGMKSHPGISATMFEVLASEGINIEMISTSPIRLSCVIKRDQAERAVAMLHEAFELDKEQ